MNDLSTPSPITCDDLLRDLAAELRFHAACIERNTASALDARAHDLAATRIEDLLAQPQWTGWVAYAIFFAAGFVLGVLASGM